MSDTTTASFRTLVIIPTYNEVENVGVIVERVRAAVPDVHVLIADDGSPDGTGAVADSLSAKDSHVQVLHRESKDGLGAAYLAGFAWAFERDYEVIVEMDADGSHQPEQLPSLLTALESADVVLGSRWVPGGSVVNWPRRRMLLSRGGSLYARVLLGIPLRDITGGYRAYRSAALRVITAQEIASQGYCFQIDLARRAVTLGYTVREVPITFVERVRGESKMNRSIVIEAVTRVARWGVQRRLAMLRNRFTRH